jgi:hypothetical protein
VPVSVRVIALAVSCTIFGLRHSFAVQAVRC